MRFYERLNELTNRFYYYDRRASRERGFFCYTQLDKNKSPQEFSHDCPAKLQKSLNLTIFVNPIFKHISYLL